MSLFDAVLVPLDGSRAAAASLDCTVWLAAQFDARLHLLSATTSPLPACDELVRLRVPEHYWPRIILHQAPTFPEDAILAAIEEYEVGLVVMSASGEAAEKTRLQSKFGKIGHVARTVIEQSRVPVLLLPVSYQESLPWQRMLVPLSGEPEADETLMLAVALANALRLEVHVAHVMNGSRRQSGLAQSARYADAPHHEYPQQLVELLRRAVPYLMATECNCITDVALVRGNVASELLKLISENRISVIVVGWRGRLMTGHADALKGLLPVITCPVLLVKAARRASFKLKVGEEIG
jgi:nucleotide-binding universal stress UspA family protein